MLLDPRALGCIGSLSHYLNTFHHHTLFLSTWRPAVFSKLFDNVKSKLSHVAIGYAERAAVAIPFLLALGFAVAAIHVMLVEHFGGVIGNWLMAGGLVCLGIIGAIGVKTSEAAERSKEEPAGTMPTLSGVPSELFRAAPMAMHLLFSSGQPASRIVRSAWRHSPLLILAGLVSLLFYPTASLGRAPRPITVEEEDESHPLASEGSLATRHAARILLAEHAL